MSILIHDELAFVMDEDGHVETEVSLDACPVMSFSDDFEAETLDVMAPVFEQATQPDQGSLVDQFISWMQDISDVPESQRPRKAVIH